MSSFRKSPRARLAALAIGVAAVAPLAFAAPSLAVTGVATPPAGQPLAGANCQADGKISGRGSTLQLWLQYDLASAYYNDICGVSAADPNSFAPDNGTLPNNGQGVANDPTFPASPLQTTVAPDTADWMVAYNDYSAQVTSGTGSSNGKTAISCRTDAFGGTDIPYVVNDYNNINALPNAESAVTGKQCFPSKVAGTQYTPPFQTWAGGNNSTNGTVGNPPNDGSDPNTFPTNGPGVMSFPIGGSAVEFAADLKGVCPGVAATLNLSSQDAGLLFGGAFSNWEQLDNNEVLTVQGSPVTVNDSGENSTLATCNQTISRVVRNDTSGTTQATLNYFNDAASSVPTCLNAANVSSWSVLQADAATAGNNNLWPGEDGTEGHPTDVWPAVSAQAGCSGVTQQGGSGGPNLLAVLHCDAGGVGYADVSDVKHDTTGSCTSGTFNATLTTFKVANAATGAFTSPLATNGVASNCSFSGASLPGTVGSDFVGLSDGWALDINNPGLTANNAADDVSFAAQGSNYPVCTLTWDFVWAGEDGNTAGVAPEPELNADQVRNLYSYFSFVLSPPAQATEGTAGYAPLPAGYAAQLRQGFQANF